MRRINLRKPSPALVISCVAVMLALGGTAVGLPGAKKVDKNDLKKNVVASKNIKDGTITDGDHSAAALSPRAYALVTDSNQVTESLSQGVQDGDVVVSSGIFCFRNLGFTPKHIQATRNYLGGGGADIGATVGDTSLTCPFAEQAAVVMDSGANITADFFVAFYD